jgi:hypothetical protein
MVKLMAVACATLAFPALAMAQPARTMTCDLSKAGLAYQGICTVPCQVNALAVNFGGIKPNFRCDAAPRQVKASLEHKEGRWLGEMQGVQPEDPTRFEVLEGGGGSDGVAKSPFGWFALKGFQKSDAGLSLTMAVDKQLPPTMDDIRILERARELLGDETKWNRQDNRTCPSNPQRWSLFCALTQATQEVTGSVHYRQPALQAAREVLNEVGIGRFGKHRIMDYNNHPDTTLAELHALLSSAQGRLQKELPK